MTEPHEELLQLANDLDQVANRADDSEVTHSLDALENAANTIGNAWSGSWLGYQALVYYDNLQPPPPGAHFSQEWGWKQLHSLPSTTGKWKEFNPDIVTEAIYRIAGNPDLAVARRLAKEVTTVFERSKSEVLSVLSNEVAGSADQFLSRLQEDVENLKILSAHQIVRALKPSGTIMTRDMIALGQGFRTPPHIVVASEAMALRHPSRACVQLADLARKAGSHLLRKHRRQRRAETIGTNVFIGHGRSPVWRDLKDLVQDRLRLPWDEFNRVPVAGVTNIARLSEMLDAAAIAFLVLTGEDEQADGSLHGRMNVVHEAGLFQGRLGFTRAVILLEEGCEAFSNIEGLGQIRFPKGNIKAAFEEIRRVLEREGLIDAG